MICNAIALQARQNPGGGADDGMDWVCCSHGLTLTRPQTLTRTRTRYRTRTHAGIRTLTRTRTLTQTLSHCRHERMQHGWIVLHVGMMVQHAVS
jgi:hypothetical protein